MQNITQSIFKLFLAFAIVFSVIPTHTSIAAEDDEEGYVPRDDKCTDGEAQSKEADKESEKEDEKDKKEDVGSSQGDGGWLEKGTKEYKVAKKTYDIFVDDYGTSSAFALGVLANVQRESKFDPSITEMEGGQNYAGRGGGLFQFTPKEKFTNSKEAKEGDDTWAPENQIKYLWNTEFKNKEVEAYLDMNNAEVKDVEKLISTDDPKKAVEGFYKGYERGRDVEGDIAKSNDYVKQAEKVFGKEDKEADKSKWKFSDSKDSKKSMQAEGSKSSDDDESKDEDKAKKDENCKKKSKKKKDDEEGGAHADWGEDGKGEHGEKLNDGQKMIKRDKLPDKLKKYALDPAKYGLKLHKHEGWKGGGSTDGSDGQCTDLSSSLFGHIWKKNGKTDWAALQNTGNGNQTAKSFASQLGGKTSDEPKKGAVFSAEAGSKMGPTSVGHTGIVSHVFKNGDVLITEQNIPGYSGDENDEPMSWNYRLISKELAHDQMTYYSPDKEGYKPKEK